jgi:hypothetical protein
MINEPNMRIIYRTGLILLGTFVLTESSAQVSKAAATSSFIDLTATVGKDQGSAALSYVYNWKMGKKKRFEMGAGIRWTTYLGEKKEFITAGPASLTRAFSAPFLIVFAGQKEENFDTLTVQRPLINAINLSFNLGYDITARLYGGVNIDVIGFSFGRKSSAVFTSNAESMTESDARPTAFNLLLTGDHDKGTLNSEFFLRYKIGKGWSVKALYQFIFAEYETNTLVQVAPDGTEVTRFRNKANNLGIGIVYHIQ